MRFLQKTTDCRQLCLSLGSVAINRGKTALRVALAALVDSYLPSWRNEPDLRIKFDRLGLKRAFAFSKRGASMAVRYSSRVLEAEREWIRTDMTMAWSWARAACLAASRTPDLVRFQLLGVRITTDAVPLLVQVSSVHRSVATGSMALTVALSGAGELSAARGLQLGPLSNGRRRPGRCDHMDCCMCELGIRHSRSFPMVRNRCCPWAVCSSAAPIAVGMPTHGLGQTPHRQGHIGELSTILSLHSAD